MMNPVEEIREALNHCINVFRSMSDRGAYPQELLPFDLYDQTKDSPLFMGKQGFMFLHDALKALEKVKYENETQP